GWRTQKIRDAWDRLDAPGESSGQKPVRGIGHKRIQYAGQLADNSRGTAEPNPGGVKQSGVEEVLLVKGCSLAARNNIREQLAESAGLHGLGIVAHVSAVKSVFIGKLLVEADREIIFGGYLLGREGVDSGVSRAKQGSIGERVESGKKPAHRRIHGYCSRRKPALTRRQRRN